MNPLTEAPLLVAEAFPPSPTTRPVRTADFPPDQHKTRVSINITEDGKYLNLKRLFISMVCEPELITTGEAYVYDVHCN